MSILELDHKFDQNCLHCAVTPLVEQFFKEHRNKGIELCVRELAAVVGELISGSIVFGSRLSEKDAVDCLSSLAAIATGQIVQSATLYLYRYRAELRNRPQSEHKLS